MVRAKKPAKKPAALPGAHRLMLDSLRLIAQHWRVLLRVCAVAAVVNLGIQFGLGPAAASIYQGIWFLLVSCALIWMLRHLDETDLYVDVKNAYYLGTAPILRFGLTFALVSLLSLPFSVGLFIYRVINSFATSGTENLTAGLIWALLTVVSLLLIVRVIFALLIVSLPDVTPLLAWRLSWRLTRRQANRIFARLLIPLLYLGVGVAVLVWAVGLIPGTAPAKIIMSLVSMGVLPLAIYSYLFKVFRSVG